MFDFLNLINLADPTFISYLVTNGFSDKDDIMRLLHVDTTQPGIPAFGAIEIKHLQTKSASSDYVPRCFLEETMIFFNKAKDTENNHKKRISELENRISELDNDLKNQKRRRSQLADANFELNKELSAVTHELNAMKKEMNVQHPPAAQHRKPAATSVYDISKPRDRFYDDSQLRYHGFGR